VLEAVKDSRVRLPPLRGVFGILDRSCEPCPLDGVGTEGVPRYRPRLRRVEQKAADKRERLNVRVLLGNAGLAKI